MVHDGMDIVRVQLVDRLTLVTPFNSELLQRRLTDIFPCVFMFLSRYKMLMLWFGFLCIYGVLYIIYSASYQGCGKRVFLVKHAIFGLAGQFFSLVYKKKLLVSSTVFSPLL